MLTPQPLWTYRPHVPNPIWDAEVCLAPDRVVGILNSSRWFCLDRETGAVLWERKRSGRPNRPIGLVGEVLVTTEFRCQDGPWSATFGVYGLDSGTGRLLWTAHAPGKWNGVCRFLDYVPGFTNELRDRPLLMRGDEVWTQGGRRISAHDGNQLGSVEVTEELARSALPPHCQLLADQQFPCGELGTLRYSTPDEPGEPGLYNSGPVRFHLVGPDGELRWQFDVKDEPLIKAASYHDLSFEILPPYVYLAASSESADWESKAPIPYRIFTIDLRSGRVVQVVPLSPSAQRIRILAVDETQLLLGLHEPAGGYEIRCYRRSTSQYELQI